MELVFKLNAIISDFDNLGTTAVYLHAEGEINRVGKSILLTNVFKALRIDPNSVSDLAVISVALDKCSEE